MTSTKSLNTPHRSNNVSISSRKKKSTFSQDFSQLNSIKCSLHNAVATIICIDPCCQLGCLLCEKCDLFPHTNHKLENLKVFIQSSMSHLEQKITKQNKITNQQLEEINKFTNEAENQLLAFVRCINFQKIEIKKDYEKIEKEIQGLLDQWKENVCKMRTYLDDTIREVRNLILNIKSHSNQESPMMKLLLSETPLEKLFDDLVSTNQNTDAFKIQKVFKHLIKIVNKGNNGSQTYIPNEDEDIKQSHLQEVAGILNEIRIKVQNPPRYKHYQNAMDKFNGFIAKITDIKEYSKDLSKVFLMSQVNLNLQLNAFGKNHNSTTISHDSLNYICNYQKNKLLNIEFHSSLKSKHKKGITCCASYGPNNFATGSFDERVIIWDLKTFKESNLSVSLKKVPSCLLTLLDYNQTPKKLVVGNKDGFIAILNSQLKPEQIFKDHESQVSCFASLKDGDILVSGAYDGTIVIYARNSFDKLFSVVKKIEEMEAINCLDIYNQEKFLTGSDDCMIKLWEISMNKTENKWSFVAHEKNNIVNDYSVNFLKLCQVNKRIIAVNSFNKINLWDIDSGRLLKKLKYHHEGIIKFGFIEFKSFKGIVQSKRRTKYCSWDSNKKDFASIDQNLTSVNLITKDPIYLLTFGEDHKINLIDINNSEKIVEKISYKGDVDLKDSTVSLMFFTDERENKIYFMNAINRENILNLWTINFS